MKDQAIHKNMDLGTIEKNRQEEKIFYMLQRGETELTGKLEMETRNRKKSHENDI